MKWQSDLLRLLQSPPHTPPGRVALTLDTEAAFVAVAHCVLACPRRTVAVTDSLANAEALADGLRGVLALANAPRPVHVLPEVEWVRRQMLPENESERSRILHTTGQPEPIYVASVLALTAATPPPAVFRASQLRLEPGDDRWPPEKLARLLVDLDYDNEMQVRGPGEYSWRGGILDLFSPVHDYPVRLDYFGDEIDAMRFFDPETQRSLEPAESCVIIPRGELALTDPDQPASFLDYFPADALQLVVADLDAVTFHLDQYGDDAHRATWDVCRRRVATQWLLVDRHSDLPPPVGAHTALPYFALLQFRGVIADTDEDAAPNILRRQFLDQQVKQWRERGHRVVFASDNAGHRERLQDWAAAGGVTIADAHLPRGAMIPSLQLVLLGEEEVFGRSNRIRPARRQSAFHTDHLLHTGTELNAGAFAVHATHGICRFLGLRTEQFHDKRQEVLALEFQDDVKVFVPLDQAHLVSRYVGAGKAVPKLSRIGGAHWKRLKSEASEAVRDLAAELLRIQAVRAASHGFACEADTETYAQFEDAFPYTETADQKTAIAQVLEDMAAPRPMDRLVCGDVGFGKTEVAMRAAAQAVFSGRQVAVLAPTTVLVQQHLLTFRERFREFPVIIESLSRFQSKSQQSAVARALRKGQVDICVGTHRLLSGDVQFKDLGLLVIDEEQRFGVLHKERLKRLRADIDVITMSATPIPRTLYLSLAGLRDMSTIVTPPEARLPVQTIVAQHDWDLIAEAIRREIQRDGQVYYLHNRVRSIEKVHDRLSELVPEATLDIGHGQMEKHELEQAMLNFIAGHTDVLVCTTIIESGMDIPNANTIIIDRADRFGLADLYQLRGRVGRYHRQAYAYLLLPTFDILDTARERLAAIRKYTQLGAGFKLAIRDLEIRGAGNLLGANQSGHINAVGFELYCQLLKEAVGRLKKQPAGLRPEVDITCDFLVFGTPESEDQAGALLPADFIEEEDLRVDCYRRFSTLATTAQVDDFGEELRDRFGALPPETERLLTVARLRVVAASARIHAIATRDTRVYLQGPDGLVHERGNRLPRLITRTADDRLSELLILVTKLAART